MATDRDREKQGVVENESRYVSTASSVPLRSGSPCPSRARRTSGHEVCCVGCGVQLMPCVEAMLTPCEVGL